jgi:hypothetical protein
VFTDGAVALGDHTHAATVTGLDAAGERALERTRPANGTLDIEAGFAIVRAPALAKWIDAFIGEVARHADPREPLYLCGPEVTPAPKCSLGEYDDRARARLRDRGGAALGTWTFDLGDHVSRPLAGENLYLGLDAYTARIGWRWKDIDSAEVQTLSGGRTLGGTIGYTVGTAAVAIALAPVAVFLRGLPFPREGPPAPSSIPHFGSAGDLGPQPPTERGAWLATVIDDDDARNAQPLLSGGATRKYTARIVIAADGLANRDLTFDGVTVAARLADIAEIGGAVRVLATAKETSSLWSFYLGGHFFLGAPARWAIPLGLDLGGGGGHGYARLRYGLRARVSDRWFVGVYPVNPTRVAGRWAFPSGLEVGTAF